MLTGYDFPALEFESALNTASGLCEALDAAGVDCWVPRSFSTEPPQENA